MNNNNNQENNKEDDEHDHDAAMPGFRFHPTEEELVEFYLRRKVEGKRFNVELITLLNLYRYDPWELPALAAIGEKEWYFYVPRDKKYRNGDRPNRVTISGYWKATGADRMIRSDQNHHRSIGLKKTLVFYSGKAPKGIRTSWIMNEYRLPHHETELLQKAEISLCRVYKRAGMEDHPSLPRSALPTRASSSSSSKVVSQLARKQNEATSHILGILSSQQTSPISSSSTNNNIGTSLTLSKHSKSSQDDDRIMTNLQQSHASSTDEFHKLVINTNNFSQEAQIINHDNFFSHYNFSTLEPQLPPIVVPAEFSGRLWDWNAILEAGKDYTNSYSSN